MTNDKANVLNKLTSAVHDAADIMGADIEWGHLLGWLETAIRVAPDHAAAVVGTAYRDYEQQMLARKRCPKCGTRLSVSMTPFDGKYKNYCLECADCGQDYGTEVAMASPWPNMR